LRVGRLPHLRSCEDLVVHVVHHIIVTGAIVTVFVGEHADTPHTATHGTAIGLNLGPEVGRVEHHAVNTGLPCTLSHDGGGAGRRVVGECRVVKVGAGSRKV
jgi:hypothetical protein